MSVLNNAQKYAPKAAVQVELGHSDDRQFAILSVQDEGPGMPPEVLQRAIEPFYRAPGTRVPGNGLGQRTGPERGCPGSPGTRRSAGIEKPRAPRPRS